jgi:hypothetical protein
MAAIHEGLGMTIPIGRMRQRVTVCAWVEVPDKDIDTVVTRPGVFACFASIVQLKALRILDYRAAFGDDQAISHQITIREPSDVFVTTQHWIYHEDRFQKRWFRVHAVDQVTDRHRFLVLNCRQYDVYDSRLDPATQIAAPDQEAPLPPITNIGGFV